MTPRRLIIAGAHSALGQEICRLAVALGHDVAGIAASAMPPSDEPWTHGVRWLCDGAPSQGARRDALSHADALILAIPMSEHHEALTQHLLLEAHDAYTARVVYLSLDVQAPWPSSWLEQAASLEATLRESAEVVVLRAGPALSADDEAPLEAAQVLGDAAHDSSHTPTLMPQLAMAALRAALEPHHAGKTLSPEEVAYLGDALMLQS